MLPIPTDLMHCGLWCDHANVRNTYIHFELCLLIAYKSGLSPLSMPRTFFYLFWEHDCESSLSNWSYQISILRVVVLITYYYFFHSIRKNRTLYLPRFSAGTRACIHPDRGVVFSFSMELPVEYDNHGNDTSTLPYSGSIMNLYALDSLFLFSS